MRCDSHIHIVGSTDRYPQVPNRTYLAGIATIDDLESSAAPNGVTRFVIVQPSFYGTDNRLLLKSLNVLASRSRGLEAVIIVKPPDWDISKAAAINAPSSLMFFTCPAHMNTTAQSIGSYPFFSASDRQPSLSRCSQR